MQVGNRQRRVGIQGAGIGNGNGMDESARVSAQAQGQPAGRAEQGRRAAGAESTRAQGHKGTRAQGPHANRPVPSRPVRARLAATAAAAATHRALSQKDGPALRPPPPRLPFTSPSRSRTLAPDPPTRSLSLSISRPLDPSGSFWLPLASSGAPPPSADQLDPPSAQCAAVLPGLLLPSAAASRTLSPTHSSAFPRSPPRRSTPTAACAYLAEQAPA
jgi:hypothetical protein